jgi:hypothetical protein
VAADWNKPIAKSVLISGWLDYPESNWNRFFWIYLTQLGGFVGPGLVWVLKTVAVQLWMSRVGDFGCSRLEKADCFGSEVGIDLSGWLDYPESRCTSQLWVEMEVHPDSGREHIVFNGRHLNCVIAIISIVFSESTSLG